jgi:hypothetical protein
MNEFLLLIHTEGDYCATMAPEQYQNHIHKVSQYIERLTKNGKLLGAQPLQLAGSMVYGNKGVFKDGPYIESKEVIIGYYHILATDLNEAREIAKGNPVFEDAAARIEIRQIKHEQGIN